MAWPPKTYLQHWSPDYFLTQTQKKQGHPEEGVKLLPFKELTDYIAGIIPIPGPGDHDHSRLLRKITQSIHGFVAGDILKFNSTYQKAQANTAENSEVVGIVHSVVDVNSFNLLNYGYGFRVALYVNNTTYFLSPTTPGAVTVTAPTTPGQISKPLFRTISTNSFYFSNWRGVEITSQDIIKSGRTDIANGSNLVTVLFGTAFGSTNFTISAAIENSIDSNASNYSFTITNKRSFGFLVELMGETDSGNYKLEWIARHD